MKGGGQGPAGPPGCRAVSPSTPAAHRHSAIRTRQTPQISLHFAEPSPLTKSFAQCPPDGTLTDIIKLVQTQLVSFYVTLIHKDQLSNISFIGGSRSYRLYRGGVKRTIFYCSVPTKVWKQKKMPLNQNGFKVLIPEN